MKFLMKILVILFFAATVVAACGKEAPQTPTDDKASGEKAAAETSSKGIDANGDANGDAKVAKETRAVAAKGRTEDGKPVALEAQVVDSSVTGTLTVDAQTLSVTGMLDDRTLRCWLKSADNQTFRGNLVGTHTGDGVQADFIISNSAGETVIKGRVGE